jgi:cysteine/glycine-rich protein
MATLGGGGTPCTKCEKTVYPAETIQFEKLPYHADCFRCSECDKKLENASKGSKYEDRVFCKPCFAKGGYAQKQRNVKWTKKEGTGEENPTASKYGGGGTKCTTCGKTAYPAETISFDKKPYHHTCFSCSTCHKKLTAAKASAYDDLIYCAQCFKQGGFAEKQRNVQWTKKETTENPTASKFGGGGTKCHVCEKTVYAAETLSYDKKPYHPACFTCHDCNTKISSASAAGGAFEGNAICKKCWKENNYTAKQRDTAGGGATSGSAPVDARFSKFGGGSTKCYKCTKTVYPAETISFEKKAFHGDCFRCKNCNSKQKDKLGKTMYKKDGEDLDVYCEKCWKELGLGRADA